LLALLRLDRACARVVQSLSYVLFEAEPCAARVTAGACAAGVTGQTPT